MVDYVSDVSVLLQGLRRFAFGGTAPNEIDDQLQRLPGADADVICTAAELLYAHYDLLNAEGRRVMAQLYNYAIQMRWSGFNQGTRSEEIVEYTERAIGDVDEAAPAPEEWPIPDTARRSGIDWRTPEPAPTSRMPAA